MKRENGGDAPRLHAVRFKTNMTPEPEQFRSERRSEVAERLFGGDLRSPLRDTEPGRSRTEP